METKMVVSIKQECFENQQNSISESKHVMETKMDACINLTCYRNQKDSSQKVNMSLRPRWLSTESKFVIETNRILLIE
jgi:hypothetical protein